ncbi:MAG: multidrug resistance protein [Chloroflexi bacterium]|nr:multidrug resistance protein [Chloroflexota bacterium]
MPAVVLIVCSVVIGVIGQLVLKSAMSRSGPLGLRGGPIVAVSAMALNPGVWAGMSLYGVSMLFWMAGLSRVELGYAYPFLSLSYVLILVGSRIVLGEAIGWARLVGVLVICFGVTVVALG